MFRWFGKRHRLEGVRVLGVDFGLRRIGLALSDDSGMLASAWQTLQAAGGPRSSAQAVAHLLAQAREGGDERAASVGAIVVGLPRRLNGEDNDLTQPARDFATALAAATGLAVSLQDERLSSREAESQLAMREKDWRRRKAQLDAAAAAVILQDYLDGAARRARLTDTDDGSEAPNT
jgi:putative Holliday junction resolvase